MNFSLINVVMFGAGAILVYSAVKDKNPKQVVSDALNGKSAPSNTAQPSALDTAPETPKPNFTVVSV